MPESTRVGRAMVNVLGRAALVLFALLFVFAFVAMACLAGCASTGLKYGPFEYHSDKDVTLSGVEWVKNADGSESFKAKQIGGNASAVDQVNAANVANLTELGLQALKRVPVAP